MSNDKPYSQYLDTAKQQEEVSYHFFVAKAALASRRGVFYCWRPHQQRS